MNNNYAKIISGQLTIPMNQVEAVLSLLNDGCTIPFIARYRKDAIGGLDETKIAAIENKQLRLIEIDKRKATILTTIEEQGKLTPDLKSRIEETWNTSFIEDLFLPYKPKRRSRAQIAREKGLEQLAEFILSQQSNDIGPQATKYISKETGVESIEDAINGAIDIIAEMVCETEKARKILRRNYKLEAVITSKVIEGKEIEGEKYREYFNYSERLNLCPSQRLLAMRRGEEEGFLNVSINGNDKLCLEQLTRWFVKGRGPVCALVTEAINDGYNRLLKPSIEAEFAQFSKEKADAEAIKILSKSLEQILLAAPIGKKRVLAINPGFSNGCKVVCLNADGNLLHHDEIYPHPPKSELVEATETIQALVNEYKIEAISIGNGTASNETKDFISSLKLDIPVYIVSEDEASIYGASKVAREEFPDEDVKVRSTISIGRRLMDPLAELIKIEPNRFYISKLQKAVDKTNLRKAFDQMVIACVNKVGVNVNTATIHQLSCISGLGPTLAKNIVEYRTAKGGFKSREELRLVSRLGEKAFQQAAGFLRVPESQNPLDNSAIHPESYWVVEQMAKDLGCTVTDLLNDASLREKIELDKYVSEKIGLPTLKDIRRELDKPGRDLREEIKPFSFNPDVKSLKDIKVGMILPGIVANITNFGAFVDVGVRKCGLLHLSQMSKNLERNPNRFVKLHMRLKVRVIEVDPSCGRLSLSMKDI